jgi:hypothetical protein
MWALGLISITAITFLLVCMRGFHAALKEKHTVWAILIGVKEENLLQFPSRKLARAPKAA